MAALLTLVLLLAHEDLELQIADVTRRIEQSPRDAALYLKRGELHRMHENWSAAREDFDRAGRLDPALDLVDLARGRMWLQAGDARQARAALDRFLEKQPDHGGALLDRARARARLDDRPGSLADYARALAILADPRPDHYIERAEVHASAADFAAAVAGLEEGIRRVGSVVTLEAKAIEYEVAAKRYGAALERLDRLAGQSPRKESWLARRAEILRLAGRPDEARQAVTAALAAIEALPAGKRKARATAQLEERLRAEQK